MSQQAGNKDESRDQNSEEDEEGSLSPLLTAFVPSSITPRPPTTPVAASPPTIHQHPPGPKSDSAGTRDNNKLVDSIQALQSKISSTEEKLRSALQRISQLKSFQPESRPTNGGAAPSASSLATTPKALQSLRLTESEEAALAFADEIFARHIARLKEYNELKDIAMGMLSIIADKQGRRLAEVMEERGVDEKD